GDLFGHKKVFLIGTTWFAIWALICGFARNPIFMSVARAIEGAGAGFTIPSALAILTTTYPLGPERTFALSMFGGAAITGQTIGVLLGGVFDATIGWAWIFYLTAIISGLLAVAGYLIIPWQQDFAPVEDRRIDYLGAASFTIGIVAVIYYLTESVTAGWGVAKTLAPFIIGLVILAGFIYLEGKIPYAIMPYHIWKSRRFASTIGIIICVTATYNTMIFYTSLTFQGVLHFNSLITACCYIVHGVGLFIGLYTVTRLFKYMRTKYIMMIGWLFIISSAIVFAQIKEGSTYWQYAFPAFIINCIGLSPTWMCCQVNAVADAEDEDQGVVGAIFNVGIQMGAPIGLAISTIISESFTPAHILGSEEAPAALMKGYSAAFYSFAVMGGVGLIAVIIFASNQDPAEFAPEGGSLKVKDIEVAEASLASTHAAPVAATSTTVANAGDKEEYIEEGKAEFGEAAEVGFSKRQGSVSSSSASSLTVDSRTEKKVESK
ncbi:hypothetical protein BGW38_007215, partial [Lunasporangiospora selenospora]